MNRVKKISFLPLVVVLFSCNSSKDILNQALNNSSDKIQNVMKSPKDFELQIIYTQVIRGKNNSVTFKDYTYNLDANNYFYPASTVKFPIALLALEKLNTIPNTSLYNSYEIEGEPTKFKFSEEITKVLAVSDNDASNHLFEFIGFDYLNESMKSKGLSPFQVSHRISIPDSGNPLVRKVTITKEDGSVAVSPSKLNSTIKPLEINAVKKGIGYRNNEDVLVKEPFDFSKKNYYPLETLHNTMKRVIFPEVFTEKERFNLTKEQRDFILFSMQNLPKNAGYDAKEYYDGYCKFFMFGDTKENIPSNIKIYNKVGDAYGTMIDCAYIVDDVNKVEFIVSATIICNKDGVFNDDSYDYDAVGFPFLGELGRQLYQLNLKK